MRSDEKIEPRNEATPLGVTHVVWMATLILFLNLLFLPLAPMIVNHRVMSAGDPFGGDSIMERIRISGANTILLGNSILGTGVDIKHFRELTGKSALIVYRGGSESAWWYLVFKNVICRLEGRVSSVVIFFRDNELTDPSFRVTGSYKRSIDVLCDSNEFELDRLAYYSSMNNVEFYLNSCWPLLQKRESFRQRVDSIVRDKTASLFFEKSGIDLGLAVEHVFADSNMDKRLFTQYQAMADRLSEADMDFHKSVKVSFLPAIIQLARENNIKLVFIRTKKRRDVIPKSQPPELVTYVAALGEYLNEEGIDFIDFTNDPRLTELDFGDGDHYNNKNPPLTFTKMVSDTLLNLANR
jgi:hypothetical protein